MTSRTPLAIHAALLGTGAVLLAGGLAGCGFTPLYADNDLSRSLDGIALETPSHSRAGYLLRQAVDNELGRDRSATPRYRLAIDLRESRAPRGVRVNNVASRYEITLTTVYLLKDAETGAALTSGSFVTQTSYDSVDAPYAGLAASQEGEQRATEQAAVRLRLELSRYITGHPYHQQATEAGRDARYRPKAGAPTLSTEASDEGELKSDRGGDPITPETPAPGEARPSPTPGHDPI